MNSSDSEGIKIRECVDYMFSIDTDYRNCILRSGLFMPTIINTPTSRSDLFEIQCSPDPMNPSVRCCSAIADAMHCRSLANPQAMKCKSLMDQVVFGSYECPRLHGTDVFGMALVLCLVGAIAAIRWAAKSQNSTIWSRQLWGLLVKNWRLSRRRWNRQLKGICIALFLLGVVVVILHMTKEKTITYSVGIPNSEIIWHINSTGPGEMRATILQNLRVVCGLLFIIAFTYPLAQVVLTIVQEKELMIREAMKITGLLDSILQLSWCISYLVQFLPLCASIAVMTHFGLIFPNFRVSVLIMFFSAFCAAMVSFCLAFSVFFDNARPAIIFTLVATFVLSFLIFVMPDSSASQGLMCLVAPACLGLGVSNALASTSYGTGFRLAYFTYMERDNFLPLHVMTTILALDAVVYAIIGWYLEKVWPQKIGIRYPWHFPFHKSFWGLSSAITGQLDAREPGFAKKQDPFNEALPIEPVFGEAAELARANRCVEIRNLTRKFKIPGLGEIKLALDNLNLTLYEGQITSLLGHNGAGKTTLIRVLCGLIPSTSGDAIIFGNSVRNDMPAVRRSLGMCPQYDILYEDLTCYENLCLFATLKGVLYSDLKPEIIQTVAELGLSEKLHQKVTTLSGGQKRKLCVAIALIGDSRVVFLDEPTSGMDPYSRRFTWEVLLKNRKGRVIILTTHFMDEAEVLGDRIAIMNDGRLSCAGSSLFLKNKFGNGYTLTITAKEIQGDAVAIMDTAQRLVISSVSDAKLESVSASSVSFQLSFHRTSLFPELFRQLECLSNYIEFGITDCTLEDVFITVAKLRDDSGTNALEISSGEDVERRDSMTNTEGFKKESIFGAVLKMMILKRWWLASRDKRQFLLLVFLPIAFLLLPIVLPDVEIVPFVVKGPHVYPVPGPASCNPLDAFKSSTSCSSPDFSDCVDESGIQIRPQRLAQSWMRSVARCRNDWRGWDACKYFPFICNPSSCCDFTDYRSLLYPCQVHTFLNRGADINEANVFCPGTVLSTIQAAVNAFIKSLAVLLAFLFCPSMVIAHAVMEAEVQHNTKFQQMVSGVRKFTYWTGAALWDFSTLSVTITAACLSIKFYTGPLSSYSDSYFVVVLLLISYAIAIIPFVYWLSFRFNSAPRALAMLLVFNIATGAGLGIIAYLLRAFYIPIPGSNLSSLDIYSYSRYVLLILPAFNLIDGLLRLQTNTISVCVQRYDKVSCSQAGTMPNGFNLLFLNFIYMGLLAILCLIGMIWTEALPKSENEESIRSKVNRKLKKQWETALSMFSRSSRLIIDEEDTDVVRERHRIQDTRRPNRDPLEIRGLRKTYSTGKHALHELWLGVKAGECFGYLGVNGAGKTTTIKCITGFQNPSAGTAVIAGHDVQEDVYMARKRAGYCPQFDALFDLLTVEEHLIMYCRIRGISLAAVPAMMVSMQLTMFKGVPSQYLSGGNRRKLSAAIAMIGQPPVIFLDEPSTGMDPHAKRFLWRAIAHTAKSTQAALMLTTHSMEECEALCSRVAILIDGKLKCIGTVQHLKSKFGSGYTIEIRIAFSPNSIQALMMKLDTVPEIRCDNLSLVCTRLGDPSKVEVFLASLFGTRIKNNHAVFLKDFAIWWLEETLLDSIKTTLLEQWPTVYLKSRHGQHIILEIPERTILLSDLFARLESIKSIENYSVSQTSLEEIFNSFAREQTALQSPLQSHWLQSAPQSPRYPI